MAKELALKCSVKAEKGFRVSNLTWNQCRADVEWRDFRRTKTTLFHSCPLMKGNEEEHTTR